MTFAPTDEQLYIQELFRTGDPLLVRASAGTGKTSTLLQLAEILAEQNRIGLYLAVKKLIADEAGRKSGSRVTASTAHSLAFRGLRGMVLAPVLDKLRIGKIPFSTTAHALGISPLSFLLLDEAPDCQPTGTLVRMAGGETKPIEQVRVGDRVVSYFAEHAAIRMRGKPVINVATRRHNGELIRVETESGLTTRYTPEHITFAKVGPGFEGKKLVYLMRRGDKYRVGITSPYHGGGGQRRSSGLAARMHEEGGDAMWVLGAYDTKAEALVEEARVSVTFGIPDIVFKEERGRSAWGQALIDGFWRSLGDMTDRAARCLAAYGRMIEHPLVTKRFNEAGNRAGYLMLTRTATIRACNLVEGMLVLDSRPLFERERHRAWRAGDPAWTPEKVVREKFNGTVHSLEVADDHSYIGDGIVTHNCSPVLAGVLAKRDHLQKVLVGDVSQSISRFTEDEAARL
ncbi:hypothetical protein [Rhodococcus zopfii]|uniref:hypothetical protein n=1 Tax=Rhodococcus zopfii TaxID=43772 RepID=UPI0009329CDA|nr:hypothetical protein [Rhodococcus zopfii]